MIRMAIRLQSGDVLAFDAEGEQLPDYQGRYEDVREIILKEATPDAAFLHWFDCAEEPERVAKASW